MLEADPSGMTQPILTVSHVTKIFSVRTGLFNHGLVRAVDDVSFSVEPGQTMALVGESGSGKTTVARLALRLESPTSGMIHFDGINLMMMDAAALKSYRRQVQAVFQNPYSSLNPRLPVKMLIGEPILAHESVSRAELSRRVGSILELVGLPQNAAGLYSHEFSGGQRQRIAIGRALALRPRLIVLDEPTSALDVSMRAQILNLLADIQDEFGLTCLLVAHDLALVGHFCTTVAVMYLGRVVETGHVDQVFSRPRHPYTQALLASVPRPDPDHSLAGLGIRGEISSALAPPSGCKFHPRCPHAFEPCSKTAPPTYSSDGHSWDCHLGRQCNSATEPSHISGTASLVHR
jgi:oligopeptide/dipeptide ABC transporter ATP-binding protein